MFHHLDANSDGILSEEELYQIEHDKVWQIIKLFGKLEASLNDAGWRHSVCLKLKM